MAVLPGLAAAQGGAPIPVRISWQLQPSWLLFAAKELKTFEKAGLAPTYVKFTTGAQMIPAMQSRSIDIANLGITPFVAGLSQGVNWKAIGFDTEGSTMEGFLARKGTDIKILEDLKGRTIGVARGSTSYYGLLAALKKKGINKDQVNLLQMDPPTQFAALLNNNIDAVAVWEPWIQKAMKDAGARMIGMESDYGVHTACALFALHAEFMKENPEAVKRFLNGLLMAYDYIQKNGPGVAIDALASAMVISKELATIIYKEAGAPNIRRWNDSKYQYSIVPGASFSREAQQMADFLFDEQIIQKKVDVAAAFDDSFISGVLKTAGK